MIRIVVVPERLRALSSQLQQAAGELRAVQDRVGGAIGGLDWEVRQKTGVETSVNQMHNLARTLADSASALARYLASKAQAFEEADRQGAGQFPVFPGLPFPLPPLRPGPPPWPFPSLPFPLWPLIGGGGAVLIRGLWVGLPSINMPDWLKRALGIGNVSSWTPSEPSEPIANPAPSAPSVNVSGPIPVPLDDKVSAGDYSATDGCALYAQHRRPGLGRAGGDGGAANYIENYKDTVFQVGDQDADLRGKIAAGYAIVWPRGHSDLIGTPGEKYGHIAVVEQVGPDYVIVSQAGWGSKTIMKIPKEKLETLYIIP